jgi:6-pyruvoyltetrahydropterin/6-carboxytetrahydropterin synthase
MNPRFGVRVYKTYFNFASSHFLLFADGTREELHGHNYQVRVRVEGAIGDGDMVLDFCRLKPIVRRCCDELDHRTLLPTGNPRLELIDDGDHIEARYQRPEGGHDRFLFPARDVIKLPISNTSTERLAELLAGRILEVLKREEPNAQLHRFEIEVEESGGQCGFYGVDV